MTWEEVRDLDRSRAVALLPVGAIEAHGPHLPLETDVVIARAMVRAGAERLAAQGYHTVELPAVTYTAAPFGADFAGTLSMSASTVTATVLDVARELTRHGFAALGVANAHLDPAHLQALAEAVTRARDQRCLAIAAPDLTRRPWATRLGEEFMSGACHAGRFEGSIVMAESPELVHESERMALTANPASLSTAIRSGARTFAEAGGARAYFGSPAEATAAEGSATIVVLGEILAEAVLAVLTPAVER